MNFITMILVRRLRFISRTTEGDKFIRNFSTVISKNSGVDFRENNFKWKPTFKRSSFPDLKNTSQFVPPPPIERASDKIIEYISINNPSTYNEWQNAKEHFYTECDLLSDVNYSSVVMNALLSKNMFQPAKSLMKYLLESNLEPNTLTYLQYMSLCGRNVEHFSCGEIKELFKKIKPLFSNTPVLDMKRGTYIIQGLCGTDEWRTSFDYMKKIPQGPNAEIKNSIASAAIRHGDETLAWEILTQWLKDNESISTLTVKEFLKYARKSQLNDQRKADLLLSKFFKYLRNRDVIINQTEVPIIDEYFKNHSHNWKLSYSKMSRFGECSCCRKSLKLIEISDEEFDFLRNSFLEKSVKKNDIFINTTQQEFSKYINFLEKRKPYHIVIDGLNVAYTYQGVKTKMNLAYHLLQAVKQVSKQNRKILVLGREQMIGWPKNLMNKIALRAHLFLTSNISQDDPFTVYAALASGPHTYLLTMDLMRDHMSRLENPKLINLFKKWQQSHQILINVDTDNQIKLTEPLHHAINVQGSMEDGWHIPVENNIVREPYEELNNWLCIERI